MKDGGIKMNRKVIVGLLIGLMTIVSTGCG